MSFLVKTKSFIFRHRHYKMVITREEAVLNLGLVDLLLTGPSYNLEEAALRPEFYFKAFSSW